MCIPCSDKTLFVYKNGCSGRQYWSSRKEMGPEGATPKYGIQNIKRKGGIRIARNDSLGLNNIMSPSCGLKMGDVWWVRPTC